MKDYTKYAQELIMASMDLEDFLPEYFESNHEIINTVFIEYCASGLYNDKEKEEFLAEYTAMLNGKMFFAAKYNRLFVLKLMADIMPEQHRQSDAGFSASMEEINNFAVALDKTL